MFKGSLIHTIGVTPALQMSSTHCAAVAGVHWRHLTDRPERSEVRASGNPQKRAVNTAIVLLGLLLTRWNDGDYSNSNHVVV